MSFRSFFYDFSWYFFGRSLDRLLGRRIPAAGAGCPITWSPNLLAPVFYGVRDHAQPVPCRVFFPSLDGAPLTAPLLEGCGRYPLILFAHGVCPEAEHYKKWYELSAQLARSGNIVVAPELPATMGGTYPWDADGDLQRIGSILLWIEQQSPYKHMLIPGRRGVVGHSYGALLAARWAAQNGVVAYASLGGVWSDWPSLPPNPLPTLNVPTFHAWGTGFSDVQAQMASGLWNALPRPKHKAVFEGGEHWDYLPPGRSTCQGSAGPCNVVHVIAVDLVCTFFAKYMPPEAWPALATVVPDSLIAPPASLTYEQQFFAGGTLMGLSRMAGRAGCRVTLSWENVTGDVSSTTRP